MTLKSVPAGQDPAKPLWERGRLPIDVTRGEQKKQAKLDFRCTEGQYHAIKRIVEHNSMPEVDSLSDCCVGGLLLFLDYYQRVRSVTPEPEIRMLLIEQEIAHRASFRNRVMGSLYSLRDELEECKREGWKDQFLAAFANVTSIRDNVTDRKLKTEASKVYGLFNADAIAMRKP
jgi:hypothetical protein